MTLVVALPLCGVLLGVVFLWNQYVFLSDMLILLALYPLSMLGITVGFHRMLTHDRFRSSPVVRGALLILGCWAFEGPPDAWAAVHIKHHAHSDEEEDPHSPLHGFWHAHVGWLFEYYQQEEKYAAVLPKDRVTVFISRTYLLWASLGLIIPYLLGGWTGLVWGGLVRIFLNSHITWSVNSVCHMFGSREFETSDESHNEWIVGLLALGEGWHNNHHAFPRNAFHGMRWWRFDLSGSLIRALEKCGLVWDVQRVNRATEEEHRSRAQRMLQALGDLRESVMGSIATARRELAVTGSKLLAASVSDERVEHARRLHHQAMERFDAMLHSISVSAHLKRQKLLQYQREAQQLLKEYKKQLSVVFGDWTAILSAPRRGG